MAVVSKKSSLFPDQATGPVDLVNGAANGNKIDVHSGRVTIGADDSANSTYDLAALPPGSIIREGGKLRHPALTGGTGMRLTAAGATKHLVNATSMANAGAVDPLASVAAADFGKPLWQMLGMAAMPSSDIVLQLVTTTNLSAGGEFYFEIHSSSAQ